MFRVRLAVIFFVNTGAFYLVDPLPPCPVRVMWLKLFASYYVTSLQEQGKLQVRHYILLTMLVNVLFSEAQGTSYVSQWQLVVCEYSFIQARLYNSQALLEGTNLMLFNINEGVSHEEGVII